MRKFMLYTVALLVAVVGFAVVAFGAPRRSQARIVVLNETGVRLPVTMVIQEVDKNDTSSKPAVLSERRRKLNLGSTSGGARKMFGFSAEPGVHRFIARPFKRLAGGVLGEPLADYQEFYLGDARAVVTFVIKAPVVPPVGQYPAGLNFVDSISGTSFAETFTVYAKDAAGVAVPAPTTTDTRGVEVQWLMNPVVIAPSFGTIIPGYFDVNRNFVGDVEGWYNGHIPLSTGGVVPFTNLRYEHGKSTVFTITAMTKSAGGGTFLRRQPRAPSSGSIGTPVWPN